MPAVEVQFLWGKRSLCVELVRNRAPDCVFTAWGRGNPSPISFLLQVILDPFWVGEGYSASFNEQPLAK